MTTNRTNVWHEVAWVANDSTECMRFTSCPPFLCNLVRVINYCSYATRKIANSFIFPFYLISNLGCKDV